MKIFSRPGKHVKRRQRFPKTKYVEEIGIHNADTVRTVYRKYSLLDNWHNEGWYDPNMGKEVLK